MIIPKIYSCVNSKFYRNALLYFSTFPHAKKYVCNCLPDLVAVLDYLCDSSSDIVDCDAGEEPGEEGAEE